MCKRRTLGTVGLACLLLVSALALGTGRALADRPEEVRGGISADNGHFEPIAQDGCVVTFRHDDIHVLTGDIEGLMIEEAAILVLDLCTGEGFLSAEAVFVGAVLGSEPGVATLRVHGEVRNFGVTDRGHFDITDGEGALAGVHAWGTYDYILGVGGHYNGLALFDERP